MASLQVTRMADYVELLLNGLELERPRMYAYEPHEPVAAFLKQVAIDTGSKSADITSSQGAAISHSMAHAFAWRPGRTLTLDEKVVKIEAEAAGGPMGGQSLPGAMHRASLVKAQMKYLVITGGVVSGLGKGVTASSLGVMMRCAGFRVTSIKIDPYLNVDAGTMSPFEHGEVFTLDDGGEVDLDLGNYERFNDITLSRDNNITTGKIYQQCLERERRGDYLGKTVQVVPHVTDAIMDWIQRVAHVPADGLSGPPDICIIELGGTVGDIESMPYVEALRQFQFRVGRDNIAFFHVSLVPVLGAVGEEKTKPTQHSVQQLRSVGLSPDFLVCRSTKPLSSSTKEKLANFTHVPAENCLGVHDVSNIYRVPLLLQHQGATQNLLARLALVARPNHKLLSDWTSLAELVDSLKTKVTIAVVGKYTNLSDAYLSVSKALNHASYHVERKIDIQWVDASDLHEDVAQSNAAKYAEAWDIVKNADGVLVPGGFGDRGVEGKICAAKWCRENKKPYLGVCLGFQVAVIEFARNILGLAGAHSSEFDENSPHPVVIFMPEVSRTHMGGTMRLGSRRTMLKGTDCLTCRLYGGATAFDERHRHRYEVNMAYVKQFEENGMNFVGRDTSGERMEVLELPTSVHPFFVGAQYHPEFKSRPNKPSPLFVGLLQAACGLPIQAAE